jgi:SAM-dependent methyltransferase
MLNEIEEIYSNKFGNSSNVNALGWGSEYSQNKRFEILLEIENYLLDDSILDLGCGYGDLSKFVRNYTGIDIRKNAIKIAKERYSDKNFYIKNIFEIDDKFDWVFASGIFCFDIDWENYTKSTLEKMFSISNKGIAFNFLSYYSAGNKIEGMKYVKLEEVFDIIINFSKKFTIRHDYLPNDMTIYLYK